jgi:hypothetical protein
VDKLYLAMMVLLPAIVPALLFALFQEKDTFANKVIRVVTLDPLNGLLHQRLFWLCIVVPLSYFIIFGCIAWNGYSIILSTEGLATFLSISTLPLGLLSISLPLTVIVASFHSTQQTARQIEHANFTQLREQIARREELEATVINTLTLIKVELHEAWKIYYSEYGRALCEAPNNQPFLRTYPLGENLFPIYDSAPACLADAPANITSEIVRTYMRMKGLITTLKRNNEKTITVVDRARIEHDKAANHMRKNGKVFSTELYTKLEQIYESSCNREAQILGMANDATNMRNLTFGISQSINSIIDKLDKHIASYHSKLDEKLLRDL